MDPLESSRKPTAHPPSPSSSSGALWGPAAPGPCPSGAGAPPTWHFFRQSSWLFLEFVAPCLSTPRRRVCLRELLVLVLPVMG